MLDLVSFGNKKSYDEFKTQIPVIIQPKFDELRQFCLELGEKLVEDVRMHRVVFCKSMTFRWFADLEPSKNSILIKIQKNRKIPVMGLEVFPDSDLKEIKIMIKAAYDSIH
tara:strand:+ start:83 stop:415 length:333 start_codon:yes stop_codon:yes gene_type:complete